VGATPWRFKSSHPHSRVTPFPGDAVQAIVEAEPKITLSLEPAALGGCVLVMHSIDDPRGQREVIGHYDSWGEGGLAAEEKAKELGLPSRSAAPDGAGGANPPG
jgi:hypothetical protein